MSMSATLAVELDRPVKFPRVAQECDRPPEGALSGMPDFRRLIDELWGAVDPDEPMLCECTGAWQCPDCLLAAPVEGFTTATLEQATPDAA
jgi:hypothetical protein